MVPSSRPTVDTKYPRAQKCCPTKVPTALAVGPRDVDRTFPLDVPDDVRHRVLWRDRQHHVDVVDHKMALADLALLLLRKLAENFTQVTPNLPVQDFPSAFRDEDDVVLTLPLRMVKALIVLHRTSLSWCFDRLTEGKVLFDRPKCQTAGASPAKPGELPIGLV